MRQVKKVYRGLLIAGLSSLVGCATPLQPGSWFNKPPSLVATTVPTAEPKAEPLATLNHDKSFTLYLEYGDNLTKDGKYADAVLQYEKARTVKPKSPEVSRKLALAYDKAGEYSKAMTEYRKALAAFPKDSDLLNDVGYCAYQQEKYSEAEGYFRKAIDVQPQNERAWVNLGLALGQQGKAAESLAAFQKVLSPAESHGNLAFVYASQGKTDLAKAEYRRALEQDPSLKSARVRLAALESMELNSPTATKPLMPDKDVKHAVAWTPSESVRPTAAISSPLPPPTTPSVPPAVAKPAVQLSAPIKTARREMPAGIIGTPEPLR